MDAIESLLVHLSVVTIVGKAHNGQDALRLATELKPDLVLMDINMPQMDGIEASKRIRKASPNTRVVVLSMYGHREFVRELLASGVGGYLLKSTGKSELTEALLTVAQGGQYIAQSYVTCCCSDKTGCDGELGYGCSLNASKE